MMINQSMEWGTPFSDKATNGEVIKITNGPFCLFFYSFIFGVPFSSGPLLELGAKHSENSGVPFCGRTHWSSNSSACCELGVQDRVPCALSDDSWSGQLLSSYVAIPYNWDTFQHILAQTVTQVLTKDLFDIKTELIDCNPSQTLVCSDKCTRMNSKLRLETKYTYSHPPNIRHAQNFGPKDVVSSPIKPWFLWGL